MLCFRPLASCTRTCAVIALTHARVGITAQLRLVLGRKTITREFEAHVRVQLQLFKRKFALSSITSVGYKTATAELSQIYWIMRFKLVAYQHRREDAC